MSVLWFDITLCQHPFSIYSTIFDMGDSKCKCSERAVVHPSSSINDSYIRCIQKEMSTLMIQGNWSFQEKRLHVNILEFKVICMALKSFLPQIYQRVVPGHGQYNSNVLHQQTGAHSSQLCKERKQSSFGIGVLSTAFIPLLFT